MYQVKLEYRTTMFVGIFDKEIDDMLSRIGNGERVGVRRTVTHTVDIKCENVICDETVEAIRVRIMDAMKKAFSDYEKNVTVEKVEFVGIKSIKKAEDESEND